MSRVPFADTPARSSAYTDPAGPFGVAEACLRDDASGCAETVSGWTAQNLAHPAIHVHLSSPAEGLVRTSELLAELNHACHDHEAGDSDLARSLRVADVMMAEGFRMYQRMLPALLERAEADPPSLVLTDSSTFAGLDLAAFLRLPLVVNSVRARMPVARAGAICMSILGFAQM